MLAYTTTQALAEIYDVFIIDLWGVIHDGTQVYPGAKQALLELKSLNRKVALLSNAPRRSHVAAVKMEDMGIYAGEHYDALVTSGEAVYQHFAKQAGGDAYTYIGPEKDRNLLDGLNYHETGDVAEASFTIVTGFDEDSQILADKQPEVDAALHANLPMICANPDLEIVRIDGTRALCAGLIAEHYASLGGKVTYFGKPYEAVYGQCLASLGFTGDASRICAIGDNLDTDIAGANRMGIDSYLVTSGILAGPLEIDAGTEANVDDVLHLCKKQGFLPSGLLAKL